ncbi:MAG: LysE family transporter [Desulfobacterales bacterium]|nr:MAG: LysE family transporter [Desulfobacterales bacterium]
MIDYLSTGAFLGLAAGFAPGPLLVLVIAETLRYNIKAGIKVALAPILTDLPIILGTVFILTKLSQFKTFLGCICVLGGLFVSYLGYESLKTCGVEMDLAESSSQSIRKGIVANALSPSPYLFWLSVGAPIMFKALKADLWAVTAFIASFYAFLVGSKIFLALVVGRSRSFLKGRVYIGIMRILGLLLFFFASLLWREGLGYFGFLKS